MAAASLLALLDDITTVLDDVAAMTKVAARKTAGVLGDDLALNAQQVTGVSAERELPVVWAVAKGSLRNKVVLVPAALAISLLLPAAITVLLMLGGAFLCFEGVEKLAHRYVPDDPAADASHARALHQAVADPQVDLLALEREKIQGAIRTDFILSAEIITITLGTVSGVAWPTQLAVLAGVALVMTVGVYGLVAGIVKLDDAGLALGRATGDGGWSRFQRGLGRLLLRSAPVLMRGLAVAGTVAMFLVGGGILAHGWPWLHHQVLGLQETMAGLPALGGMLAPLVPVAADLLTGVVAGTLVLLAVRLAGRWRRA
ncbi:hypothetical protein C7444_10340 [Sphaerotilus hippei]|uniref:Inner membrane protein YedI n=1 Tax=Sphaerotilus hippei TaxID=744406 RepID=A0A318HB67_9BURK|nr:DUF808 domain-containing protein [Sphaerotilus hippei]PXW97949.1 hypothetical protein C7444_10340 [Sphaerotilus hippei]